MFIGLTYYDSENEKVLVNADNITYAERDRGTSRINFTNEDYINVEEDLSTILNRIRKAEALAK